MYSWSKREIGKCTKKFGSNLETPERMTTTGTKKERRNVIIGEKDTVFLMYAVCTHGRAVWSVDCGGHFETKKQNIFFFYICAMTNESSFVSQISDLACLEF
jgi:hypothetical protein